MTRSPSPLAGDTLGSGSLAVTFKVCVPEIWWRHGGIQLTPGALSDSALHLNACRVGEWQEALFTVFWKRGEPGALPVVSDG